MCLKVSCMYKNYYMCKTTLMFRVDSSSDTKKILVVDFDLSRLCWLEWNEEFRAGSFRIMCIRE